MKVLLTGHRGFIGSNLHCAFKKEGYDIDVYEWGDTLPEVKGKDWVVHVGAISSTTESNIDRIMLQNVDFSIKLYEECRKHQVNFQFSSSASLYGLGSDFRETAMVDPRTPYAWSKYLVERHIMQNPLSTTTHVFRYFNVYGSGEEHKQQPSPHTTFRQQFDRQGYVVLFEGSERYFRDFISVEQVTNYHLTFMKNVSDSGIFNIGTGKATSFLDVALSITPNLMFKPMPDNLKNSYQAYTCADMSKTKQITDRSSVD